MNLGKLINWYNRLFSLWVTLGGISALVWPWFFVSLRKYLDLFFALTMLGIGLTLELNTFKNIFRNFWVVLVGVVSQFTIMPLGAFFIARIFNLSKEFSLGLVLTGSAPGAMASNVLSYLAGADVAYSISLTASSTLLCPIFTPGLTYLLAHTLLTIPFLKMFFSVIKMVVLPLILGIYLKHKYQNTTEKLKRIFPAISTTFIVMICALVIALNRNYIFKINPSIFVAVLSLNLLGLILGYQVGRFFRFSKIRKRALSIEIGMQNAGLGTVLALKHFNERVALPAVIFVFVCIFTAAFLVAIWRKDSQGGLQN